MHMYVCMDGQCAGHFVINLVGVRIHLNIHTHTYPVKLCAEHRLTPYLIYFKKTQKTLCVAFISGSYRSLYVRVYMYVCV